MNGGVEERKYSVYSTKTITSVESPCSPYIRPSVCVCVCVYLFNYTCESLMSSLTVK